MAEYILGCLSGMAVLAIMISVLNTDEITPMDVYQNKTTLKYEVVDGVKVDSVVVWKEGFKK